VSSAGSGGWGRPEEAISEAEAEAGVGHWDEAPGLYSAIPPSSATHVSTGQVCTTAMTPTHAL
jgi:hypothetical protein